LGSGIGAGFEIGDPHKEGPKHRFVPLARVLLASSRRERLIKDRFERLLPDRMGATRLD